MSMVSNMTYHERWQTKIERDLKMIVESELTSKNKVDAIMDLLRYTAERAISEYQRDLRERSWGFPKGGTSC